MKTVELNNEELQVVRIALAFLLDTSYGHDEKHFKTRDELCKRLDVVSVSEQPYIVQEKKKTIIADRV